MRDLAIVLLSLIWALPLTAQRHGRPDSAQRNAHSIRPPELVLTLGNTHQKIHLSSSDLNRLRQSVMVTSDPKTNKITTYEGVLLEDLLASLPRHTEIQSLHVSHGFFHKSTITALQLNPTSEPLIAPTVNGKHLSGDMPFCLIAKDRQGHDLLIRNVTAIRVMQSR